jgi:hypothetical protein
LTHFGQYPVPTLQIFVNMADSVMRARYIRLERKQLQKRVASPR